jgi:hypothetical protein
MTAAETFKDFIFKPIAGLKDFSNKIVLNDKRFKEFDYIYFELVDEKKEACISNDVIIGTDKDMYKNQYEAGKENNKVEKLGPKADSGFIINYLFRNPGRYRLCHQSVELK